MKRIREKFASLRRSRRGATAIEYGLIVSLIALGAIAAIEGFGAGLGVMWNYISQEVLAAGN
jgi:pilus assembly protein Flp/PilA